MAIEEVKDSLKGAKTALKNASDPKGLADKAKRFVEFIKQFHDQSQDPQKTFTWDEVAKYDGEGSRPLYIVIDSNVYDITEFGDLHPAGPEPLKKYAGKDATSAVKVMNADVYEPFLHYFLVGQVDHKDNSTASQYVMKNTIQSRL